MKLSNEMLQQYYFAKKQQRKVTEEDNLVHFVLRGLTVTAVLVLVAQAFAFITRSAL
jgi:hypothetical protein